MSRGEIIIFSAGPVVLVKDPEGKIFVHLRGIGWAELPQDDIKPMGIVLLKYAPADAEGDKS